MITVLTLDYANQVIANAHLGVRLKPKGFEVLRQIPLFARAIQHCLSNGHARSDLANLLARKVYAPDLAEFVDPPLPAQPRKKIMKSHPQSEVAQASVTATHTARPTDQSGTQARQFDGHHVYGRQYALYISADETRAGEPTLSIDGAKAVEERKYDWRSKLRIQVTRGDLPDVACVLFGLIQRCELKHYGADNSKRLTIENQGKHFFVNMAAKGYPQIAVPVSASDLFEIRALMLQQLLASRPTIGPEGMLANLKLHAAMLKSK